MQNVHAVAELIGKQLGIRGPYFPDCYSQPKPGLLSVRIGALTFAIDGPLYRSIVVRAITVEQLRENLIIDRPEVADALYKTVQHLHRTGPVRARAFEWEFARVAQARKLEPRRRQLLGLTDGPEGAEGADGPPDTADGS